MRRKGIEKVDTFILLGSAVIVTGLIITILFFTGQEAKTGNGSGIETDIFTGTPTGKGVNGLKNCGNGICDQTEDETSCPEDCLEIAEDLS